MQGEGQDGCRCFWPWFREEMRGMYSRVREKGTEPTDIQGVESIELGNFLREERGFVSDILWISGDKEGDIY